MLGLFAELAAKHGADDFITKLAAIMVGSSETTFYVLTVYFGSVGIKNSDMQFLLGLLQTLQVFYCQFGWRIFLSSQHWVVLTVLVFSITVFCKTAKFISIKLIFSSFSTEYSFEPQLLQ